MTINSASYVIRKPRDIEWPTLALIGFCMAAWPLVTIYGAALSMFVSLPILTILVALHSSLQHEVLHGHPFKSKLLNEMLVFVPVGLFVPYRRFRDTHIQHHYNPDLTDPYDDPETNYLDPLVWNNLGGMTQFILTLNNTLAGRIVLGPAIGLWVFYKNDLSEILKGDRKIPNAYLLHFVGMIPLIWWLANYCSIPFWAYILAAYCGLSLLKIRTFLEHQADADIAARSVIIEDRGFWSLLFLNNNFHWVHHSHPKLAWYQIPAVYFENRDEYLRQNHVYLYKNYGEIFRKYLLTRKDDLPHPLWPKSNDPDKG